MKLNRLLPILVLLPSLTMAQALTATLSWTPSTTRVDGTPLTGSPFFNVYQGPRGAEVLVQSGIAATSFTTTLGLAVGSTVCFQVTQVEASTAAESARSVEVCKVFPNSPPIAPSGVTVR